MLSLLLDILGIDSTSGHERPLAEYLLRRLPDGQCTAIRIPEDAPQGSPVSIMLAWGEPQIVFCTHLDTVPPYIPPTVEETDHGIVVRGRGACDAKGQIAAMYTACRRLAQEGATNFGLLLLHGEETGSFGAKEFRSRPGGKVVIVGEPTDNRMVRASKGTKAFAVTVAGEAFHSGYPEHGVSAVDRFIDFMNALRAIQWPEDPVLGATTWNIGCLQSDNPQNILSPLLTCRIYFRTTFASDTLVCDTMAHTEMPGIHIEPLGGDTPSSYLILPGFDTTTVAFGSDAPQLTNFPHRILCGPGSILVAHRPDEHILLSEMEKAADMYTRMFRVLKEKGFSTST